MKEQIESWLTLHKIDIIKMFYSGSGDEGCIHSMYFYDKISYLYEAAPNEDGVHYFPHYYNLLEIAGESLDSFVGGGKITRVVRGGGYGMYLLVLLESNTK